MPKKKKKTIPPHRTHNSTKQHSCGFLIGARILADKSFTVKPRSQFEIIFVEENLCRTFDFYCNRRSFRKTYFFRRVTMVRIFCTLYTLWDAEFSTFMWKTLLKNVKMIQWYYFFRWYPGKEHKITDHRSESAYSVRYHIPNFPPTTVTYPCHDAVFFKLIL